MPRPPTIENPVRILRDALGKTQSAFANEIGISAKYLQKIELGERRLTDDLADFFMAAFGVTQDSVKEKTGRPLHLLENEDHLDLVTNIARWQSMSDLLETFIQKDIKAYFLPKLQLLFTAAGQQKRTAAHQSKRILQLALRLDRWINDVIKVYDLNAAVAKELKERKQDGREVIWEPSLVIASGNHPGVPLPGVSKIIVTVNSKVKRPGGNPP
jgi:transcriptional regulator with XRE-family HTH domain